MSDEEVHSLTLQEGGRGVPLRRSPPYPYCRVQWSVGYGTANPLQAPPPSTQQPLCRPQLAESGVGALCLVLRCAGDNLKEAGRGDAQKHVLTVLYPRSAMGDGAWDKHTPLGTPVLN